MAKKPMTKAEMVAKIATDTGITKAQAQSAIESLIDLCKKEVKAARPFRLSGLGTFAQKKSKARKGRNPATGEQIKIAASKRMAFKASSQIKDLLNPKK